MIAERLTDADIEAVARRFLAQVLRVNTPVLFAKKEQQVAERLHRQGVQRVASPPVTVSIERTAKGWAAHPRLTGRLAAYRKSQLLAFRRGTARTTLTGSCAAWQRA